jgi:hypothetical protein
MATVSAARILCCAAASASPRLATQVASAAILVALVAVGALVIAMASATRYMGAMLNELMRVARTAIAFVFTLALIVVVALAVLIHR